MGVNNPTLAMDLALGAAAWAGGWCRRWAVQRVRARLARWRTAAPTERGGPRGQYGSMFERRVAAVLARLWPAARWRLHERPAWLTYPPTGRRLELDFWDEQAGVAVEADGLQHRVFVPGMHRTRAAFAAQRRRDRWKDRACAARGVVLLRVPDTESLSEADIERCLRQRAAAAGLPIFR